MDPERKLLVPATSSIPTKPSLGGCKRSEGNILCVLQARAARGLAARSSCLCRPSSAFPLLGLRSGIKLSRMATLTSSPRTIACVQLDSKHGKVAQNTETVLNLVARLIAERKMLPIDLLVLPELALTGYVFEDWQEIEPLLEDARLFKNDRGAAVVANEEEETISAFIASCKTACGSSAQPSLALASHLAQYLHCHVVIGFPELGSYRTSISLPAFDARPEDIQPTSSPDDHDRAFNSAALFSPGGNLLHVFRKHFLYETDDVWASEGPGFQSIALPGLGNVCIAICMDLNPYKFVTEFQKCELATFCVENDVDLLVMPMAWLLPKDEQQGEKTSLSTVNYWALRCLPFFEKPTNGDSSNASRTRYFVATNRTGTEGESTFAGSSSVLQMKVGERPTLLDGLGTREEACLVVTLPE